MDERTEEQLFFVDEERRAEARQCLLWTVMAGRVGELQERGQRR
jgi:hypothetical protein